MKRVSFIGLALALLVTPYVHVAAQQRAADPGALTGIVVDEGGQPLANAAVQAVPLGEFDYLNRATATTDDEGRFTFDKLEPTSYRVSAEAAGYVAGDEATAFYRPGDEATLRMRKGGVITGAVTSQDGEPLVGVLVTALRVRSLEDERLSGFDNPQMTYSDDRGVYRIFGLGAGAYVVSACGRSQFGQSYTVQDGDAPTFYPSSTRAEATEVTVHAGEEARGIDIRHRGARARSISGTITGAVAASRYGVIVVTNASDGSVVMYSNTQRAGEPWTFEVPGLADGEYLLTARAWSDEPRASAPRRVAVKGADVSGVTLALEPLATVEGSVTVEKPSGSPGEGACAEPKTERPTAETIVSLVPETPPAADTARLVLRRDTAPGADDAFAFKGVPLARYRFDVRPPSEDLFVVSITQRAAKATSAAVDLGRDGLRIATGARISGVTVELAHDAAGVSGVVKPPEGAALPRHLIVHLVPAEAAYAEDVVRYREVEVDRDGAFDFVSVAPGKYWLLVRTPVEPDPAKPAPARAAWRADTRTALRRDAEKAGHTIELAPCERVEKLVLEEDRVTVGHR